MIKNKRPIGTKKKSTSGTPKLEKKSVRDNSVAKVKKSRLPRAKDLPELRERRAENSSSFREKAARGLNCKAASTDEDLAILDCLLGEKDWLPDPIASNLPHRDKIAELTSSMMLSKRAESPSLEVGFVTMLNRDWETSLESTEIDIYRISTDTRSALNKMASNSLGVVEIHPFANVKHEHGGALLSPQTHNLIWGIDIKDRTEAAIKKLQCRFRPRFDDVDGIQVKWVGPTEMDLAYVTHYPWKAPCRCKTLYKNLDTGKANVHQSEANDRYIRYLRMVHVLSMMRTDRIMFGSGQGGSMRADILREANSALRSGDKDRHPPIHSEGIAAHIVELMSRINETRFELPVIKYRKK